MYHESNMILINLIALNVDKDVVSDKLGIPRKDASQVKRVLKHALHFSDRGGYKRLS
jgi:hypothetical protein